MDHIGIYSKQSDLCKKWSDLRKLIQQATTRSPLLCQDGPLPRLKRYLSTNDLADIAQRYESGSTTKQIATDCGISKTRVATVLREQGVTIRRQGLDAEQIDEAVRLYAGGMSLAQIGEYLGVDHGTVWRQLRKRGVKMRDTHGRER